MIPAIPFTLYSRTWCHLCEDMLAALRALETPVRPFAITVLDVDADPALVARFDELVPVLFGDPAGLELCHYFLDMGAVQRYLAGHGASQLTPPAAPGAHPHLPPDPAGAP